MNRPMTLFLMIIAPMLAVCLAGLGLATLPTNPLGGFLFLTGSVYAAGTVIFALVRRPRFWEAPSGGSLVQEERGDRSFWLVALAMMAVFYLSPLEYLYGPAWLPRSTWTKSCGLGLVVAGSALFVWARRTLGASYSGHVSVDKEQSLVRSGPYRFIRHPAYAGFLCMALGIGLGYSSLAGLVSAGALLPALVFRIHVEERLLARHFGEAYRQYANQVKRLIPVVW